ncbi:hypothetical protein ACJ73_08978 [Blastomyces percursus]|uniref:Uncharacterized protein n=1 Tax=Blastomyces percursus TaxID=1658174 RepID=A0A1J9Q5G9_9EURO|nr:hypothetical protein ACJ73_08978 [Blastomyces percursus]
MDSSYEDEDPGPQLSVELLRSIWTTQQYDDDDASSHGEDIPANSAIGKRKRQDSEVLRELSPPLLENNARTLSPFESVKLKRPQPAERVVTETARNNRSRKDIYVIPDTPKPLKTFTRNLWRNSMPKSGTFNDLDSKLGEEDDLRAAYRSERAESNVTHIRDDEKVSASEEGSESWSEEGESPDEDQQDENYRSEEELKEYTRNRGLKQTEPSPNLSTPRRSSRLRVLGSRPSYSLARAHRGLMQAFSSPESAGRKRPLTRLMKKMLESVETGEPPHSSPPPRHRAAESDDWNGSEVSSAGEDPMHEDTQQAVNRAIIFPLESPENDAGEGGGDVDTEKERRIALHNPSEHDVRIRRESENNESDREVQIEHGSVSNVGDFEDGSQMESDSRETDAENVFLQDPADAQFWQAAALFGQHTNWSDLLAEAKKLIPSPNLTQKSRLLCKALAVITQAKQLYARTREIRQDDQTVPHYLCEAEKSNAQEVVEQISHILSRVRLVFDENGNIITDNRDLMRKRQAVNEIAVYAVPEVVSLLKICLAAHYVDNELSVDGMKQLTQLLQSFSLLCERIQPKFFLPYIHFRDTLQQIRVVVRFLWTFFDNQSYRLQTKRRLERLNNIQQKSFGPHRNMQYKRPHRREVTLTPNDEQDDRVSIISIDEGSSNEQLPEGSDEFPWTTAESETLVTGLERYQGPDRYTMILRDFRTELSGRTMEDLRVKAREIRDSYVAAMRLDNFTLDPRQWSWLLEV